MKKSVFLTVIIPCYNEEKNLKRGVLTSVRDYFKTVDFDWEIVISDDGSSDDSKKLVKRQIRKWQGFSLLENKHGGKPMALWHGIKKSKGEQILFLDMDQSTPITELDKLLPFVSKNVGAVIGSRGLVRKNFPVYRKMGSILFMTFRKLFILPEINDTQCGFKLFKKSVLEKTFHRLRFFQSSEDIVGWQVTSFDVELLHLIKKAGFQIEEVPVSWKDADISESKGGGLGRYLKESREMLFQIFRVKYNDILGKYDDIE